MNKDFIYEEQKQLIEMWKNKYYEQKEKLEQLEIDYKEANDSITWWQNRFNSLTNKTYKELSSMRIGDMSKEELFDFAVGLLDEIWDYDKRIDKAIEYIEWQKDNPQYDNVWRKYECESLINILKGDSDE